MSRDLGDPRQNTRLRASEKRRAEDDDEALRAVLRSESGRRMLCRLARDNHWMGDGWDGSSARQTDFNAGQRSAAIAFMGWAERVAPEEFLLMLAEATRRDVEAAATAAAATIDKEQHDG